MIPGYAPAEQAGYSVTPDPVTKALHLAALGLAVLPVRADKTPATARGVHDATTDAELIVDAFIDTGAPLVGVACGASGIVVIDIDRHPGGADGFASLVGADLPHTWATPSLSGLGQHRVHAAPAVEVTGSKPLPGVDIKAGAGYVVWAGDVPPSRDVFTPAPAWTITPARAAAAPSWTAGVDEWRAGNDGLPEGGVADRIAAMPPHGAIAEPDLYGLALGIVRASRYDEGGAVALDELRSRYASGQWAGAKYLERVDRAIERAITAEGSARLTITDIEVTLPWLTASGVVAAAEAITAEAARSPYADVAAILSGNLQRPKASIGFRSDEQGLFYAGAVNQLIGDPESGKSLIAAAVAADTLFAGGRVLWIDLDHNGAAAILSRFRSFGVSIPMLSDVDRFRLVDDAEDADTIRAVVAHCREWVPTLAVIDSQGELLPLFGASSDSADDYTRVNREVSAAIGRTGAGVLVIDHMAKGAESRKYGAGGTMAKKRAADGVVYRVENITPFAPGSGGKAALSIVKDRHGDIRANTPGGRGEPVAATFEILPGVTQWRFHAPGMWETGASLQDQDVTALSLLDPPPATVRDVKARLGWGGDRATRALAAYRDTVSEAA